MEELYNLFIPYFDTGFWGARQYEDTDRGKVTILDGKDVGINDVSGNYFYIRWNGQGSSDDIEETCGYVLKEESIPFRVVARFVCADMTKVKDMLLTLMTTCSVSTGDWSTDAPFIISEETDGVPKKDEHLVMIDGNLLTQKAYSANCTEFDICKIDCCDGLTNCWGDLCLPAFLMSDGELLTSNVPINETNDLGQLPNITTFTATDLTLDATVYFPCDSVGAIITVLVLTTLGGQATPPISITVNTTEITLDKGDIINGCTTETGVCVWETIIPNIYLTGLGLTPTILDYNVVVVAETDCGSNQATVYWRN